MIIIWMAPFRELLKPLIWISFTKYMTKIYNIG